MHGGSRKIIAIRLSHACNVEMEHVGFSPTSGGGGGCTYYVMHDCNLNQAPGEVLLLIA